MFLPHYIGIGVVEDGTKETFRATLWYLLIIKCTLVIYINIFTILRKFDFLCFLAVEGCLK